MLRFAHSIWTKPAQQFVRWDTQHQYFKDLWFYALSAHYIKKNGHKLVLHTDELGEQLFGVLPYDEILRTLDNVEQNPIFWAAGKIQALKAEPLGSIHVDGDAFIKSPELYASMEKSSYDLLVQSDDYSDYTYKLLAILQPYLRNKTPELFVEVNQNVHFSYNCGVLSFRKQVLKDEFVRVYEQNTNFLGRSNSLMTLLYSDTGLTCDLVLEQKWVKVLADQRNAKVRKIIYDPGAAGVYLICTDEYEHSMWISKYLRLPEFQNTLRQDDYPLYQRVRSHIQTLGGNPNLEPTTRQMREHLKGLRSLQPRVVLEEPPLLPPSPPEPSEDSLPVIKIRPVGKYDYDVYPITEDVIDIDEYGNDCPMTVDRVGVIHISRNDLDQIRLTRKFRNGRVVKMTAREMAQEKKKHANRESEAEIVKLRTRLGSMDYLTNKYVEGKLTSNEWAAVIAERDQLRQKIAGLNGL